MGTGGPGSGRAEGGRPESRREKESIFGQFTHSTSHLVGLTKHGKEEVKFVNCTEIQAVHFRGQLWDQIILIMQISSPSGRPPVASGDHGAASASCPATPVATAHLLGWGSTPLPGRGRGRPVLREGGALGRHHTGILPCSCPWLCQKAEKARGLHTEVFTFLLRKIQPRTWHVLKHLVPAEA